MRILYLLSVIYIGFALTSCASSIEQPANPINPAKKPAATASNKNPMTVTFYKKGTNPKMPYKIIGEESISKYNLGGIKRQEGNVRDAMRQLAAAMGGDAVINLKHDAKSISGTVIAYQKDKSEKVATSI